MLLVQIKKHTFHEDNKSQSCEILMAVQNHAIFCLCCSEPAVPTGDILIL